MPNSDNDSAPRPPIVSNVVPWQSWSEGARFGSRFRHLTIAAVGENYRVGVQIEVLSPGKQSSPAHYHLKEEEHVLILEGSVTLRLADKTHPMTAGDYVCFPAGQRAGHCFVNEGVTDCRMLVIGEKRADEVCVYTDSNKVMIRALGEIYDKAAVRDYWAGEATNG